MKIINLMSIINFDKGGDDGGGDVDPVIKTIQAQVEETGRKAKEKLNQIEAQLKKYGDSSDKLVEEFKSYEQKNLDLEKQLESMGAKLENGITGQNKSTVMKLKDAITENDIYKSKRRENFNMDISDIMCKEEAAPMSVTEDFTGDVIRADRRPGVIMDSFRRTHVRDFMTALPTSSDTVDRVLEESHTSEATTLSEGSEKPQSSAEFKKLAFPVEEIAHTYRMTLKMYNDAAFISGYIRMRGVEALKNVEDTQILTGNGQSPNLHGMIPAATAFNETNLDGIDEVNRYDVLAAAVLQGSVAEFEPNIIFINKKEAFKMRHAKDAEGRYIFGNPWLNQPMAIDGSPIIAINAMPDDTFLTADLNLAVDLFDRQQVTVDFSFHDRDNFVKNLVTFRIVERLALAIWQPKALVTGQFSEILPS